MYIHLFLCSLYIVFFQVRASEAVAKLRTSVGLRVDKVLGPGVYNAVQGEAELCGKTYLGSIIKLLD